MSYKALYRTYRPTSFDEVVGQQHIIKTLVNAVKNNKLAHAYLFCGPRGTGKTTVAKILAKTVNCENPKEAPCNHCSNCEAANAGSHPDIVEIDAASNTQVDKIRDLIEKVKYAPIQGRFKIYIIDEVHMLSPGAFNALLKTLEEPPAHVIFILATTEPHKVLPTIISRCQRYDFGKVSEEDIVSRLHSVLKSEKLKADEDALQLIAELADGGMRDALSILDQCIAYAQNNITIKQVNEIYGITTTEEKMVMLNQIFEHDSQTLLEKIQTMSEQGIDIRRLTSDLIGILKEGVEYNYTQDSHLLQMMSEEQANSFIKDKTPTACLALIQILMETMESYRTASNISAYFEVAVLKMMNAAESNLQPQLAQAVTVTPGVDRKRKVTPSSNNSTEEKGTKTAPKLTVQPVEEKLTNLGDETIFRLFGMAKKPLKDKDIVTWSKFDQLLGNLDYAKQVSLLRTTEILASGENFLVLECPTEAVVNQINEENTNKELYFFCKNVLKLDKMIYAIEREKHNYYVETYKVKKLEYQTMEPLEIKRYKETKSKTKEKTTEVKLQEAFGDLLEIQEEDNK